MCLVTYEMYNKLSYSNGYVQYVKCKVATSTLKGFVCICVFAMPVIIYRYSLMFSLAISREQHCLILHDYHLTLLGRASSSLDECYPQYLDRLPVGNISSTDNGNDPMPNCNNILIPTTYLVASTHRVEAFCKL